MKINKVGVILVDYQGSHDTKSCLNSLTKVASQHKFQVYLVNVQADNPKLWENHELKPRILDLKDNLGFAGSYNLGIKLAHQDGCDAFILLNNDTVVDKNFIDPLIKTLSIDNVGLVSPKIYFYPGREYHINEYQKMDLGKVIWYAGGEIDWQNIYAYHWGVDEVDHGQFGHNEETDFATGCCVGVRKDVMEKVGSMNEKYFLYWEDVDWSVRIKKAKYRIVFEPKSVIWHKNASSTGGSGSLLHRYYQTRNRIVFANKYASVTCRSAVIKEQFKKLSLYHAEEKRAIIHAMIGRLGKW